MKFRHCVIALAATAVLLAGCGSTSSSTSSTNASAPSTSSTTTADATTSTEAQISYEGVPIQQGPDLASPDTTGRSKVDGIECGATEQLVYHVHAHLTVYVNGQPRALPGGIGIPGSQVVSSNEGPVALGGDCFYWLHTHAPDGVIHIESPTERIYTLGNFFDVWRQPLSGHDVAGAKGTVSAVVNGKPWTKNPRDIPLNPHAVIQLSVGLPIVPFHKMSWSGLDL